MYIFVCQFALDLAGLIPVVGEIADGVNGVIYAARGDALNATLSFSAMIPFAGWVSTGGKFVNKGSDLYQARNVLSTEKVESIYSPIYQDVVNSPLGKTQNQLDILSNTHSQLDTPNALMFDLPNAKTDIATTIKSGDADVKTEIKNVDGKGTANIGKEASEAGKHVVDVNIPENMKKWDYPPNDGFVSGTQKVETLQPGTGLDRYGNPAGSFLAPESDSFPSRALAPHSEQAPYYVYEVIDDFEVTLGKIAPWFDQPGGGTQIIKYKSNGRPYSIEELIELEVIKQINP